MRKEFAFIEDKCFAILFFDSSGRGGEGDKRREKDVMSRLYEIEIGDKLRKKLKKSEKKKKSIYNAIIKKMLQIPDTLYCQASSWESKG